MPVVRMATFSTCANAGTTSPSSMRSSSRRPRGNLMILPSPVPNREDNPAPDHHDVQEDADGENGLHAPSARRGRTTPDDPDLVAQGADGDGEKERLQPLEHQQAASAQYGKDSKSSLDLREHSSTGREQSGDDREHARPLGILNHRQCRDYTDRRSTVSRRWCPLCPLCTLW